MKKILFMLIGVVAMLSITSCSYETVDENQVGVLVKRPYIFGSDGTEVLMPGRHVIAASSTLIPLDKTPEKYTETFTNLTTKDKSDVDFDFYFNISVIPEKTNILYGKFNLDWYKRNLEPEFRRVIRNKCMGYDMIPITSDASVAKEIETHVLEECQKVIKDLGMPVLLSNCSMGKAEPPKAVLQERANTQAAKQRENTLKQENKNLEQSKLNEQKRAEKDQAYMREMKLSATQFIQLEQLRVQEVAYQKASTVIVDGSSEAKGTYNIR